MKNRKITVTFSFDVPAFLKDGQAAQLTERLTAEMERQVKRSLEFQHAWAPWRGIVMTHADVSVAVEGFIPNATKPGKQHRPQPQQQGKKQHGKPANSAMAQALAQSGAVMH